MFKALLLFFLIGFTAIELWLLLSLGNFLGVWGTMAWMVLSFILGFALLRVQGLQKLLEIQRQLLSEVVPGKEMMDMALILGGAFFMILPGFFTDFLGASMFIPPVRWFFRGMTISMLSTLVSRAVSSPVHRNVKIVNELDSNQEKDSS